MKQVRVCVAGCGLMGKRHAKVVQGTAGFSLGAVCDKDAAVAQALATECGVPAMTLDEALESKEIDAVVLALPSHLHGRVGLRAIEAGKHVIMEKPIAIAVDDGRNLVMAARRAGVVISVISQNRFSDGARSLKAALDANQFGHIVLARASVKWFRHDHYYTESDWRGRMDGEGGGVLINQAIHSTDLLIHFLGRPKTVVALTGKNRSVIETEDTAVAVLGFSRGVVATLEASTSTFPGFEERYEIHGQRGSAILERGKLVYFHTEDGSTAPAPPPYEAEEIADAKLVLFQRQYLNIHDAIENGADRLLVRPEESLWVLETTQQMYQSAAQLSNETLVF